MADQDVVKGYDPAILRRLLGFLRPEVRIVILAVLSLLIATATELLVPIVLRRTIDEDIIVSYRRLSIAAPRDGLVPGLAVEEAPALGEWIYLRPGELASLSTERQEELVRSGTLDPESFYLFPVESDEARAVVSLKPGLFVHEGRQGAIRVIDLDRLSGDERLAIRASDVRGISIAAALILSLLVCVLIFSFVQVYLMARAGQNVMKRLRLELFGHTLSLRLAYLQQHAVGGLVTRATNDVETISELFATAAISLVKDVFVIVGVVITMILLDARLAAVAIVTVPPVIVATVLFRRRARSAFRRVRHWVSQVNGFLSEHISGMHIVQLFAAERRSLERFVKISKELLAANLFEVRVMAIFRPLVDLFTTISLGVVLFYGASGHLRGSVSLGVLIAFVNLIAKFYRPIQDISEKFTVLQSAMAGAERVFELLDTDETVRNEGTSRFDRSRKGGEIEFDRVNFAYYPEEPVLRDLSFRIGAGERIAIVGYTGAGKSTIINLLTRMWDIDSGSISIDGKDIRSVPLDALRSRIQPVQQDVFLFAGTVAENIGLGRKLSSAEIVAAAEAVFAREFIEALPHGFETEVTESGANLSTGQRQLISFARVLVGRPDVIILDEATSSIDTETERLIQEALEVVLAGRTSLVIAHRLSTIRHTDRILVLAEGRLAEEGSHEELLQANGTYATLHRLHYSGDGKRDSPTIGGT